MKYTVRIYFLKEEMGSVFVVVLQAYYTPNLASSADTLWINMEFNSDH